MILRAGLFLGYSNAFGNHFTVNGFREQTISNPGYSMMSGTGMTGGYYNTSFSTSSQMPVTAEQALQLAQQYLDQQYPGYETAEDVDPFYG